MPPDRALEERDIVGSNEVLEIGTRRIGLKGVQSGTRADQPFVVIRECTFDEWHAWLLARLKPGEELDPQVLVKGRQPGARFYEISTD
jgi:hypothetical protein